MSTPKSIDPDDSTIGLAMDGPKAGATAAAPGKPAAVADAPAAPKPTLSPEFAAAFRQIWKSHGSEVGSFVGLFVASKDGRFKDEQDPAGKALAALSSKILAYTKGDPDREKQFLAIIQDAALMRLLLSEVDKKVAAAVDPLKAELEQIKTDVAALKAPKKKWWQLGSGKPKTPKPPKAPKVKPEAAPAPAAAKADTK